MRSRTGNQNKFLKIITIPIRVLKKGRDLYVKGITDYAEKPRYSSSSMMGISASGKQQISTLPKSFSTITTSSRSNYNNYESEDLRELIRANSTTRSDLGNTNLRNDMDLYLKQLIKEQQVKQLHQSLEVSVTSKGVVPRSVSVGMGRIDEEEPFEFEEEESEESVGVMKRSEVKYPRSRSHAVGKGSSLAVL